MAGTTPPALSKSSMSVFRTPGDGLTQSLATIPLQIHPAGEQQYGQARADQGEPQTPEKLRFRPVSADGYVPENLAARGEHRQQADSPRDQIRAGAGPGLEGRCV